MRNKNLFLLFISISFCLNSRAQVSSVALQQFLSIENNLKSLTIVYPSLVSNFYKDNQYQLMWVNAEGADNRQSFFEDLERAHDLGLNAKDYHYDTILKLKQEEKKLLTTADSVSADLQITDAAIHFYSEVMRGNQAPVLSYDGLKYQPDISSIPFLITEFISKNHLSRLVSELEPKSKEYNSLKTRIIHLNLVMAAPGFKETLITSSKVDSTNKELVLKLYQLGVLDTLPQHITIHDLKQKLQSAQTLFNILKDGQLRSNLKQVLNVSLQKRKKELVLALNYVRWLNEIKKNKLVVLNIPSASLFVYDRGDVILESRVIVGKPSTRTPTLSSRINEVIMYPYWHVPNKIATRELLPSIKKDHGFLERNSFQVLSKQGKVLDPASINWQSLSTSYFPYQIRQSTGCDNSLGIVKLNFYNPFTVYLHDTPGKGLFFLNKRYFSHGCMRVEKAIELARLVASDHVPTIDSIETKGCTINQSPLVLPADQSMNLIVLYSTAWFDAKGAIAFYDDVYRKMEN